MTILLDILLSKLISQQKAFEEQLSQVYQSLLAQHPKHLLVQIHDRFDFGPLEAACNGYYHQGGVGAPPTYCVGLLLRAELLRYLYNLSLRDLEANLQMNLLMKWFVGLGLLDPVPDHSTLERFEVWLDQQQHRTLFDEALQQIDQSLPASGPNVQIGDTFAMRARAAEETLIQRLRHLADHLLKALEAECPEAYLRVIGGLDEGGVRGHLPEKNYFYLDQTQRSLRQQETVLALLDLKERVQACPIKTMPEPVQVWLDHLDKILQDEVRLVYNPAGQIEQVVRLSLKQRGSYRIGSITDPEATYRVHGDKTCLGYNISLSATPQGIIREIQAATGAQADSVGVPDLILQQEAHGYPLPDKEIYDQAAGAGKTRHAVEQASQGRTQLVAKVHSTADPNRFGPDDFHLSEDGQSLTCPNHVTTQAHSRATTRDATEFYFSKTQCQACPLWKQCRSPKAKPTSPRKVFISDYCSQVAQAREYNQTPAFKADMRLRPRIERQIFMLTHYDGARHARRYGLQPADFQAKMAATARNLRTWIQILLKRETLPAPRPDCA